MKSYGVHLSMFYACFISLLFFSASYHISEADFLRAIESNLVGDTITLVVQRYIENGRTGIREFGSNQGARRAIETTLKLKLAQSGLTR